MFVKLTSGFLREHLVLRNLVLQDFLKTRSKSCKLEVTFAIHHTDKSVNMVVHKRKMSIATK